MELLLGASLALSGIVAGIYASVPIHDRRIADLSGAQYAAMHQMRDKTFRVVMPPLTLTTLALAVSSAGLVLSPGLPCALGAVAALLMVVDIIIVVTRQVPLNTRIRNWAEDTIPADWTQLRDRWSAQHNLRLLCASVAYACLLAAALWGTGIR